MGWDASAVIEKDLDKMIILNPTIDKSFEDAYNKVIAQCGKVDMWLRVGMLDYREEGEMLYRATGVSVYDEDGWNPDYVKNFNSIADWKFSHPKEDQWKYLGAKYFLQVCAKHGLAIKFSW